MKENKNIKKKIILSSFFTLLPSVFALFGYVFLNEKISSVIPINESLPFVVFIPIVLFVLNAFCVFFTLKDNKNRQNDKILTLVFSICPFISILTNTIFWSVMFNNRLNIFSIMMIILGAMFIFIGNYLPKCKQNKTIGIKIKWTLLNEENWNATHRFGGKIWFLGGLSFIISAFFPHTPQLISLFVLIVVLSVIPAIYSYIYYKKQISEGTWKEDKKLTYSKKTKTAFIFLTLIILIFCVVIVSTGEIEIYCNGTIEIKADYWSDLEIQFSDIENIEYRMSVDGERISGFGTHRLLLGLFKNEEFGAYTRYTYTENKNCIVLKTKTGFKVINLKTESETKDLYEKIKANISQ